MKPLIIVNLVYAAILVVCFWIFAFFAQGAFVNPVGLGIGVFLGWCVLIPMFPGVLVLLVFNIYGVFRYWSKYKLMTLLPFLILGVAIKGLGFWDVHAMSIRRFEKYLPDYETIVERSEKEHKPGDWDVMGLPEGYRHLGYLVVTYDDKPISDNEPNTLFVSFEVGHFGVFGHTHFLYSSNGEITSGSKAYRGWPHRYRVNEHWFRVSD